MPLLTKNQIIEERKKLCARLKGIRTERGLTLSEASTGMGISEATLSKHENAKTPFGIDTLIKICRFYEIEFIV